MRAIGNVLNFISIVLIGILSIMYVINGNHAYYRDFKYELLLFLVLALVFAILPLILKVESRAMTLVIDLCRIVVPILVIYTGIRFLAMRVESFGYIFASNLEAGNEAAMNGAMQAVWTLVLFVLAWVLTIIVSFFSKRKIVEQ